MTRFEHTRKTVALETVRAAADRVEAVIGEALNVSITRLKKIDLGDLALLIQHARNTTLGEEAGRVPDELAELAKAYPGR